LYVLAVEPVSELRVQADHRDLAAAALVLLAILLLFLRWSRLDRGALVGTGWLGEVLREVHAAVRRRLFAEAAAGATLTTVLLCLVSLAHLAVAHASPRSKLDVGRAETLAGGEPAAPPQEPASLTAVIGDRTTWAPHRLLFLLGALLFLWLLWTYWAPLGTGRYYWLRALPNLHRYQSVHEPVPTAVRQTCEALAYCTRRAVLYAIAPLSKQHSALDLWQNELLLSLNRTQRDAVGTGETFRQLRRLVLAIEAACDPKTPLLDPGRVRLAFGGSRWRLTAAVLALAVGVALAAICWRIAQQVIGRIPPF
jgi:hypothetical protein